MLALREADALTTEALACSLCCCCYYNEAFSALVLDDLLLQTATHASNELKQSYKVLTDVLVRETRHQGCCGLPQSGDKQLVFSHSRQPLYFIAVFCNWITVSADYITFSADDVTLVLGCIRNIQSPCDKSCVI